MPAATKQAIQPLDMADRQAPKSLKALNRFILAAPPLVKGGGQAVLGEGPVGADIAFVGERPGDQRHA